MHSFPHYSMKTFYALVSEITKQSLRLCDGVTERVRSDSVSEFAVVTTITRLLRFAYSRVKKETAVYRLVNIVVEN